MVATKKGQVRMYRENFCGVLNVVIVTYNCVDQIEKCLRTCLDSTERYVLDFTVVDNGSTDETVQVLRNYHDPIRLIESTNLGFAHGCNLGIKEAFNSGKEYQAILFLNPDALLTVGSIDQLMEVLLAQPQFGGVSPRVVDQPGSESKSLRTLLGVKMNEWPVKGRDAVVTDRLAGCCMLWRSEAIRKTGFFDENYFLYWEELDYSARAISIGFSLLHCDDVIIHHRHGNPERTHRVYYMWRNQFRFARQNYSLSQRRIFFARRSMSFLKGLMDFAISARLDLIKAAFAGLAAGFRSEVGMSASLWAGPN